MNKNTTDPITRMLQLPATSHVTPTQLAMTAKAMRAALTGLNERGR